MKSGKLIAYASDFASFLIENISDLSKINTIILFGSVARKETGKGSDVDIFVDANEKLEAEVHKIVLKFYKSVKFTRYWSLFGIKSEINCIVGSLEAWTLKRSIISNGIVLYGRYKGEPKTTGYALFKINVRKRKSEQVKLWRALYGYKQTANKKVYTSKGMVKEGGGRKLANSIFIVPLQYSDIILKFLRKKKIKYEFTEIWSDML